jgi:hypothetical protein
LWELYPAYATFVDGRTDVFSPGVFEDYLLLCGAGGLEGPLSVGTSGSSFPRDLHWWRLAGEAGWETRYGDDQAVVLLRPRLG